MLALISCDIFIIFTKQYDIKIMSYICTITMYNNVGTITNFVFSNYGLAAVNLTRVVPRSEVADEDSRICRLTKHGGRERVERRDALA